MALSIFDYQSKASWAALPANPPSVPYLIRSVQAADAEEMTRRVQQMLAEVTALNAAIVDANIEHPDPGTLQLAVADIDLAGGGDGHTFVLTVTFLPLLRKSDAPLPESLLYGFVTGSTAEIIEPLLSEKADSVLAEADLDEIGVIWQAVRGAAKGTRFMAGFAAGQAGAQGAGALVQLGFDQSEKAQLLSVEGVIPRSDAPPAPLQVQLPNVTPGNILEVDFNIGFAMLAPVTLTLFPVVSFDGSVVVGPGWFVINNGMEVGKIGPGEVSSVRGLVPVVIPEGATTATVQLFYLTDEETVLIGGFDSLGFIPGCVLRVSEYAASAVSQSGAAPLVPY
jgi:hypothetical protein